MFSILESIGSGNNLNFIFVTNSHASDLIEGVKYMYVNVHTHTA